MLTIALLIEKINAFDQTQQIIYYVCHDQGVLERVPMPIC